jgi:hypothetical protein
MSQPACPHSLVDRDHPVARHCALRFGALGRTCVTCWSFGLVRGSRSKADGGLLARGDLNTETREISLARGKSWN